ncbi:hypothetical protein GCM10028895_17260 [Pontibacter rugosus]
METTLVGCNIANVTDEHKPKRNTGADSARDAAVRKEVQGFHEDPGTASGPDHELHREAQRKADAAYVRFLLG